MIVAPQLGYELSGGLSPGGLLQFGRCVARAIGSSPSITKLGVWCQVDKPGVEHLIEQTIRTYAHPKLELQVRVFGGSQIKLASAVATANLRGAYDRAMYLLVNQSVLGLLPFHVPYDAWEIGEELFRRIPRIKYHALCHSDRLLSISHNTAQIAAQKNIGLPEGKVVHLCTEPPLFSRESTDECRVESPYDPTKRNQSVMIVGNMHRGLLYKGHQQLIAAWSEVIEKCPNAQLWIVGGGGDKPRLEDQAHALPSKVSRNVIFMGRADADVLAQLYQRCRVFAMPSLREGFGLVFVEAARYGVPCIGGKHDSVKEIVLHNQTGLLVEQEPDDIASACLQLLTDDVLARSLGEAGRKRYQETFRFCHFRERLLTTLELSL
ncbi:MAG: glycosyltransferase family 4 protein [Chloroflexi bacterium]|nr:glycosyltransferase family 4 protein [Chloroflexota bacterium]